MVGNGGGNKLWTNGLRIQKKKYIFFTVGPDSDGSTCYMLVMEPPSPNRFRHRPVSRVDHRTDPVTDPLAQLRPIRLLHPLSRDQADLFAWFLARYHYLSFRQPVGQLLEWLWTFVTRFAVFFRIDPTRSGDVPIDTLGERPSGSVQTQK